MFLVKHKESYKACDKAKLSKSDRGWGNEMVKYSKVMWNVSFPTALVLTKAAPRPSHWNLLACPADIIFTFNLLEFPIFYFN